MENFTPNPGGFDQPAATQPATASPAVGSSGEQGFVAHKSRFKFHVGNKAIYIFFGILVLLSLGSSAYILTLPTKQSVGAAAPAANSIVLPTVVLPTEAAAPSQNVLALKPTATPTPRPSLAGWKLFTNTTFGYSIQYPPDWSASQSATSDPKIPSFLVFNPTNATGGAMMAITISSTTRTYQEQLALGPSATTPITVASVSATKSQLQNSDGVVSVQVVLPYKPTQTIVFVAQKQFEDTLTNMLSTFKFLQ
ncbi:MAG TPA: hypothetical protein VLF68_00090 [Candidatus Saccharimonadales bacterium]|nr:hypothetical protein [Candidatus Saccharimonadales bacterium]